MKRIVALVLAVTLIASTMGSFVLTAETVYPDIILGSFENASTDGWLAGDNTGSAVSTLSDLASAAKISPEYAAQGAFFLQVAKGAVVATTKSYIVKNFSTPLDLSNYKYINYEFFGWAGTSATYSIDLVVTSTDSSTQTYTVPCSPSTWMGINIDISAFAGRNSISSLKIAYYGNDLTYFAGNWTGCFNLDGINASNVISNPTGAVTTLPKQVISDFEAGTDGWVKDSYTNAIAKSGFTNNASCLEITKDGVAPTIVSYVKKTYAAGSELNLSSNNIISFDLTSWGGAAEKYGAYLVLSSSNGSSISLKGYGEANIWNTLLFDISGFADRASISSIKIGVFCDGVIVPAAAGGWAGHFFIDNIIAYSQIGRLFDFEYGSGNGWAAGDNIYPGSFGSTSGVQPYPTIGSHGTNMLMGQKTGSPGTVSSFIRNYSSALDLGNFKYVLFDFFNHGGASNGEQYKAEMVLTAGASSVTYDSTVGPNEWRKLQFDISGFAQRNAITQIKINFYALNPIDIPEWNAAFFIDNFCVAGTVGNVVTGIITTRLSDFENGLDGWQAGINLSTGLPVIVTAEGFDWGGATGKLPASANQGLQMLRAVKAGIATTPSYVVRNFPNLLDLSVCNALSFDLFAYGGSSTSYVSNLILTSKSGYSQTFTVPIEHSAWRTVQFDISSFTELNSISSIQIGYCGTDTSITGGDEWAGQFYIDDIRATGTYTYSDADLLTFGTYNKSILNNITNIVPNTGIVAFKSVLTKSSRATLSIKNSSGTVLTDSGDPKVGTGTTIDVIVNGYVLYSYKVLIYGDVNGNGDISIDDLYAIKGHLNGSTPIQGAGFLSAGDVYHKGSITISDLLAVKKSILGLTVINQA